MELLLHIGDGKTGTTSIQRSLASNEDLLLQNGLLCHDCGSRHFNLVYALGRGTRAPKHLREKLEQDALQLLKEIHDRALAHKVEYVLLS